MKPWQRRALYALVLLAWLVIITLPLIAFVLAARGEIRLGDDPQRTVRIFLISEDESGGIGLQRTSLVSTAPYCAETRVRYLMWRGGGESAASCQCYADSSSSQLISTAAGECDP